MKINIWWIRRDLRLQDNPALHAAIEGADAIIPLFVLDPFFETSNHVGEKRRAFLYANLGMLNQALQQRGGGLIVRRGHPLQVLKALVSETQASGIFAQEDVSPYANARDHMLADKLPLRLTGGLTVHPPAAVRKPDGSAYTVFTPYSKAWKRLSTPTAQDVLPAPEKIILPDGIESDPIPTNPSQPDHIPFPPGEQEAQNRLSAFADEKAAPIFKYSELRNRMDVEGTSALSPYLRFGLLSPRQAIVAALEAQGRSESEPERSSAQTWLNELIWREFFISILANFPQVRQASFREDLRAIAWQNDREEFEAWTQGKTGYPVVDAAMRQLLNIGWMHNRARMIVASFLVKDLLIDWRWGEQWFMQHLLDGDPAANNGGWQWSAGTGTDAAPYFRIFNPILQSKKFDPEGKYIRRWIPELAQIPTKYIHTPWEMSPAQQGEFGVQIGQTYPGPVIDHAFARQRTLDAFKRAKSD